MSRRRKLTCGFEELSLSVLEMEGNVKGVGGEAARSRFFYAPFTSAQKSSVWQQTFHKKYVSLFVNSPYLVYNKVESMCADTVSNSLSTFVRKNVK